MASSSFLSAYVSEDYPKYKKASVKCVICNANIRSTKHKCNPRNRNYKTFTDQLKFSCDNDKVAYRKQIQALQQQNVENILQVCNEFRADCGSRLLGLEEIQCSPDLTGMFYNPSNYFLTASQLEKDADNSNIVKDMLHHNKAYWNIEFNDDKVFNTNLVVEQKNYERVVDPKSMRNSENFGEGTSTSSWSYTEDLEKSPWLSCGKK